MFCYLGDMLSVDGDADAAVEARVVEYVRDGHSQRAYKAAQRGLIGSLVTVTHCREVQ